jgi:hypothetical protein
MLTVSKKKLLGLFIVIAAFSSIVIFHAELQRLNWLVDKYTEKNISKNWGLRKKGLETIQAINNLYPDLPQMPTDAVRNIFDNLPRDDAQVLLTDVVDVSSMDSLITALKQARAGQTILLRKGVYKIPNGQILNLVADGEPAFPIALVAETRGEVIIEGRSQVAMKVRGKHWQISDLILQGVCKQEQFCEHAIQVVGDADFLTVQNTDFIDFNAHIKSNGLLSKTSGEREFPDNVLLKGNRFFNKTARNTNSSVTPIDVVGGDDWVVEGNFISDFAKLGRDKIAYGAFLKGGGSRGVFDKNVVVCSWQVDYVSATDVRVGLSFGGGGTGAQFCAADDCQYEHQNGQLTNNIIANCSNDVSVYINRAKQIDIQNNILIGSQGIDIHHGSKDIRASTNMLHGKVTVRDAESSVYKDGNRSFFFFQPILE